MTNALNFAIPICAALGLLVAPHAHADLHVDPVRGNDSNPGTNEAPMATLSKARDTIRAQKLNQKMTADLTVWLKGGRYELAETLVFDERDSGSNGKNIAYRAVKGEIPIICGGRKVTGWKAVADKPYFVASVPRHTPVPMKTVADPSYDPPPHHPRFYDVQTFAHDGFADYFAQLYVNGVRAERARTHTTLTSSQAKWWDDPETPEFRDGIIVKKSAIKNYTRPQDLRVLWLELFKTADVPVIGIMPHGDDQVVIKMKQPGFNRCTGWARIKPNTSFFILNALEELDEPGEWYLDQKNRLVYYYPFQRDGDLNQADVLAPNVEVLVRIAGSVLAPVSALRFDGITFQGGNWTGAKDEYLGLSQAEIWKDYRAEIPGQIILNRAQNITISACTIRQMGSCGIQPYEYCKNILIDGNITYDTTGAGISVGRYWFHKRYCEPASVCQNVVISNNVVRKTGRDYWQATGINLFAAGHCQVNHNDISDTAYTALHARIGDDGAGGYWTHPSIGSIQYAWNKVSHGFQGHKWGIGDGGHLYMHGRYGNCKIFENHSLYANSNINLEYYSDNNSFESVWTRNVSQFSRARTKFGIGQTNIRVTMPRNHGLKDDPATWPEEAKRIMANAGLEPKWRYLGQSMYGHASLTERKKCWSSSTAAPGNPPELAVDTNWGSCWASKPDDAAAYLAVDLGAKHVLQRITLMPRQDKDDEHARRNLEVQASNDPDFKQFTVLCERGDLPWYRKPGDKHVTNMWEQYMPALPAYRYLRVMSKSLGSLSLAEFSAYGYPER